MLKLARGRGAKLPKWRRREWIEGSRGKWCERFREPVHVDDAEFESAEAREESKEEKTNRDLLLPLLDLLLGFELNLLQLLL